MRWELDWLENRARLSPDSVAIIIAENNKSWTYKQINNRAKAIATWISEQGVRKGDRVALISKNDICYFDLLFACGKVGAIFVPINWRLSMEEINDLIQDCSPKIVVYHSFFSNIIEKLPFKKIKHLQTNGTDYNNIVEGKINEVEVELLDTDPLVIVYTGGSTGKPKGVVLSHQSIIWNGINSIISWSLSKEDTTLTYMPLFHIGGLNALSIPILMIGGTVVVADNFEPVKAMSYLNSYKCTIVLFVPTMYHLITETQEFVEKTFPFTKIFLAGGAPCPLEIYEKFHQKELAFKEGYGLTEAGPNNFFITPADAKVKRGSVGKPMIFNAIKLVKEDGTEARENEVGEILIKGKHAFSYYWNNEKATQETVIGGWIHTGDLAKRDSEGYYYIVGRKKDMIITGGENVYPLEVEQWLATHPHIKEVAVIGIPDRKWGEIVSAFISLNESANVTEDEVIAYCRYKLGNYKIPRKIVFLKELPKTPVGKIDKSKLKRLGVQA